MTGQNLELLGDIVLCDVALTPPKMVSPGASMSADFPHEITCTIASKASVFNSLSQPRGIFQHVTESTSS